MRAELVPVEIHGGIAVYAIEFNTHTFALPAWGSVECVAVPANAAGEESSAGAAGVVLVGLAFDAPVVGQVDGAPGGIGKGGRLGSGGITKDELPAGVGREVLAGRVRFCGAHRDGHQACQCDGESNEYAALDFHRDLFLL